MALDLTVFRKVVAPEYATMTEAELTPFVIQAELEIAPSKWGKFTPRAVALMVAHLIKMGEISRKGDAQSPEKQVKKTKVGDLEKEFAVTGKSTKKTDPLDFTIYGQEYKRLRKSIIKTPLFVGP